LIFHEEHWGHCLKGFHFYGDLFTSANVEPFVNRSIGSSTNLLSHFELETGRQAERRIERETDKQTEGESDSRSRLFVICTSSFTRREFFVNGSISFGLKEEERTWEKKKRNGLSLMRRARGKEEGSERDSKVRSFSLLDTW
jgi:hypothetical protein